MVYGLVRPGIPQARYSCDVGDPSVVVYLKLKHRDATLRGSRS